VVQVSFSGDLLSTAITEEVSLDVIHARLQLEQRLDVSVYLAANMLQRVEDIAHIVG